MTPPGVDGGGASPSIRRVVDALYVEAMLLADEARGYFEGEAREVGSTLDQTTRVLLSCESLRVTTRLMHVIAWLLTRRAVWAGELSEAQATSPSRRLASPPDKDEQPDAALPAEARRLLEATASLYRRTSRLDGALASALQDPMSGGPVLAMQQRLAREL